MCAEELKWLVRIILKQMKVGATEKTFFDAWHPDADALFNVSSSLRRVCWELFDTDFRMQDDGKGVKLMSCFQPQLAQFQKKQLEHVVKAMGSEGEEFWIEEKLDGERMQMHFSNGEFRWWSRKAKEYTHLYGSSFETGSVARFATDAFDKRVKSIILDGEMITWDPKLDCIVGFGTLKTAAIETSNNPVATDLHRPLFRVFDILYLNDTSLLHYTLAERRHALAGVLKNVSRRIEIHPYLPATTKAEIESELRKVIASSSEGLVIKNPRSQYQLNDRNDDWVKVKPEYMTEFGESLDCLVVGGYWGSGHRGNILSSYLCALRVGTEADPMKFWSFCRVGGGFTAHDYSTIAHRTDGHWVTWDSKNPPSFLELAGGRREFEKPDMWIHPERSFVVEIKAASVATSDMFRTNLTLRFPRFKKLRTDKSWQTSLSFQEFLQLRANADREAAKKSLDVEQRRGQRKRVKKEFTVAGGEAVPQFAAPPEGNPHLFEGKAFYVMTDSAATGTKKKSKAELEALIKAFGGRIFQSEKGAAGLRVIGERNTVKVSALKKLGNHDIIRPQWVLDCIRQQEWLPLEPRYMFHIASDDTRELVETGVDGWGDSYARDLVDAEELRSLMEGMRTPLPEDRGIVVTFRDSCFPTEMLTAMPGWLLANCKVFVDPSVSGIARTLAEFAGATLVPDLFDAGGISHVLVGRDTLPDRVREIRELIAMWNGPIPRIVMERWVDECISEKTRLDEERFVAAA
jgi:DNA ligase-4